MAGLASLQEAIRSAATRLVETMEDDANASLRVVEAVADGYAGKEYTAALQAAVATVKRMLVQCAKKDHLVHSVRAKLAIHGLSVVRVLDKSVRSCAERFALHGPALDALFADALRVACDLETEWAAK